MMTGLAMSTGMMVGMGAVCLLVLAFLVLGIVALIKYLRSPSHQPTDRNGAIR